MIRQFWAELNTPDTFHADPYGGGMNQLGHIALGAFFAGLAYVVIGVLFGEMPYKVAMLASMLFLYGGVIEWQVQGSSLKDGAQDTLFFMLGVLIPTISFSEVRAGSDGIFLRLETGPAIAAMAASKVCLILYIIPRAWRKYR